MTHETPLPPDVLRLTAANPGLFVLHTLLQRPMLFLPSPAPIEVCRAAEALGFRPSTLADGWVLAR